MRKKGLVYRATTFLGLSIIAFQFGGELIYSKYFREDRDREIQEQRAEDDKITRFEQADAAAIDEDLKNKRKGIFSSWGE